MTDDALRNQVRAGLARRVAESRGVCASGSETPDVPLIIEILDFPEAPVISKARIRLQETWARPDGEELVTAIEVAEVDRQLRLGGYYAWTVEPDREWLRARRAYKKAQREWITNHPLNVIDSPERLERAILRGEIAMNEAVSWFAIRPRAEEPPKEWRTIDDGPCVQWSAMTSLAPCVYFATRIGFAERLTYLNPHVPYFGAGKDAARDILKEDGSRSIVASLGAHGTGRNLQAFSTAVLLDPGPSGATWEQTLGRLHRPGQRGAEVRYLISSAWADEAQRALANARWLATSLGQPQRLLIAERKGRGWE